MNLVLFHKCKSVGIKKNDNLCAGTKSKAEAAAASVKASKFKKFRKKYYDLTFRRPETMTMKKDPKYVKKRSASESCGYAKKLPIGTVLSWVSPLCNNDLSRLQ